jgi:hypothetical protein
LLAGIHQTRAALSEGHGTPGSRLGLPHDEDEPNHQQDHRTVGQEDLQKQVGLFDLLGGHRHAAFDQFSGQGGVFGLADLEFVFVLVHATDQSVSAEMVTALTLDSPTARHELGVIPVDDFGFIRIGLGDEKHDHHEEKEKPAKVLNVWFTNLSLRLGGSSPRVRSKKRGGSFPKLFFPFLQPQQPHVVKKPPPKEWFSIVPALGAWAPSFGRA